MRTHDLRDLSLAWAGSGLAITGSFPPPPQQIDNRTHTEEHWKEKEEILSKTSVDSRKDGKTVSEIRWAFLRLGWVGRTEDNTEAFLLHTLLKASQRSASQEW